MKLLTTLGAILLLGAGSHAQLKLHYNRPAQYFEEALVIGNGNMGATVYGGTDVDHLSLNDITLWTGGPDTTVFSPGASKYIPEIRSLLDRELYTQADSLNRLVEGHFTQNYQPLGDLYLHWADTSAVSNYRRELDISTARAMTSFSRNGYNYELQYYCSAPDSVLIIDISTDNPKGLDFSLDIDSKLPHSSTSVDGQLLLTTGYASHSSLPGYVSPGRMQYDPTRGTRWATAVKIGVPSGGLVTINDTTISVTDAPRAIVYLATATSFNGPFKDPATEGRNEIALATGRTSNAYNKPYEILAKRQIDDYRHFFNRVTIDLGETSDEIASLTTDEQLRQYTDSLQSNPDLEELYFQMGRYLLISCSRTEGVPANLQGLWNEHLLPPWSSNYTTNINVQENYWPALVTNLHEMNMPLIQFIKSLSKTGATSAREYYGVNRGWNLGQNSDIWATTNPVGELDGDPMWACWTMGGAWIASHIWEHYQFTRDTTMLREYYPVLKGAAEFCLDWLIEKDGCLVTSPGTSPENQFYDPVTHRRVATSYGCTADLAMTRQCLMDAIQAAQVLDRDSSFVAEASAALSRLTPYKIGARGQLQEWYHDFEEVEPGHRHQSHLYGLYPGHHISPALTPELAQAARRTLELRGDKTTGWSTGWRINLYARLLDGENAYNTVRSLLKFVTPDGYKGPDRRRGGGTYPNLLDAHSPFQIDGNFGGTAGYAEMLLQSTEDEITILPALPQSWAPKGKVTGLRTRGGQTVDITWQDRQPTSVTITTPHPKTLKVTYHGKTDQYNLTPDETTTLTADHF